MTSPLRNPSRSDSTPHAIELRNGSRYGTQASIPTTSSSMLLCFFFKLQQLKLVVTVLQRDSLGCLVNPTVRSSLIELKFGRVNSDPGVNQRESRDLILMEFSASAVTTSSCTTDTFDSDVFALLIKTWNCTSNLYFSRVTETEGRMLFITPHNDFAGKDRSITSDDQRNNSSHVRTETETNVSPMAFLEALLLHILTLATGFIPQLLLIYLY
ncbi:hypothetical protein F2Q69_00040490 [Brassica cretica]|uniref:Uncharacterized protein n=1 Tax=Brassica cretica TaxID=69181 RepID=A0A8S9NFI2_BRACR|nr:hypothetical protein F2Q69_00040490 [Brassica cretica]